MSSVKSSTLKPSQEALNTVLFAFYLFFDKADTTITKQDVIDTILANQQTLKETYSFTIENPSEFIDALIQEDHSAWMHLLSAYECEPQFPRELDAFSPFN